MILNCTHSKASMFLYGICSKCQEKLETKSPINELEMGIILSVTENKTKVIRKVKWADEDDILLFNEDHDLGSCRKSNTSKVHNLKKCLKPILKHRPNCVIIVYDNDDME